MAGSIVKQNAKNKKVKRNRISPYAFFCGILIILLFSFKVYSDVELNELTVEATNLKSELKKLKNEETRLNVSLEKRTDLKVIEKKAQSELGLTKVDKSQIEYISLPSEDKVEVKEESSGGIISEAMRQFSIILEFLN